MILYLLRPNMQEYMRSEAWGPPYIFPNLTLFRRGNLFCEYLIAPKKTLFRRGVCNLPEPNF